MADEVLFEMADEVAILTLNRPDKLNALSFGLIDLLMQRLDTIEIMPEVRAIVLVGSGDRAFSAGADIAEFRESVRQGGSHTMRDFVRRGQAMTSRLEAFPKPIVAAVNGLAYGGGCEIVEAVHLAVASDRATFAKPEIKLGMPPTFGGTQRLPRLVGRRRALEMLLVGDPISASRASDLGLVNSVVAFDDLRAAAIAMARQITRHSAECVQSVLAAVTRGLNVSIAEGLQIEGQQFARLVPTGDLAEGLDAWLEKRAPHFTGAQFRGSNSLPEPK